MSRAKESVRSLYGDAAGHPDPTARVAIAGWAKKSEHEARLRAMIFLAQSESGISLPVERLDTDGFAFNVRNGTLDLRTGRLRPHGRADLLTKLANVDYRPDASCPTFEQFLSRIFGGNARVIGFLQRAVGYSLTGDTSEQVFFLLWGSGANGKTTFLKTIFGLLGDYAISTRPETFMVKGPDAIPNDVARLRGARFVIAVEADQGQRLAESLVKQATGSDVMTARFMRAEYFDFVPAFKIFLATNHKPIIRGTDLAMWRRVRLIPFTVTIPPAEQDRQLEGRLREEWPGILRWAVEGCLAWQREGLGVPEEVRIATAQYRTEMDVLGAFLRETCVLAQAATVSKRELYNRYLTWADEAGERPISKKALGLRLAERGIEEERVPGERRWRGIRFREPSDTCDTSAAGDTSDTFPLVDSPDARAAGMSGEMRHNVSRQSDASHSTTWEEV